MTSTSRFARRAYVFDEAAHPRGEGGRFITKTQDVPADDEIIVDTGDRGPTQMIQMNAAVAEDVMRRNDIDAVMGEPLSEKRGRALIGDLMDKYAPDLPWQAHWSDEFVDQYGNAETAAFTTRGMTEQLPKDHEMYNKDIVILAFRENARPVEVIHEMAHVVEGSWRNPPDDGHSLQWYETYYDMLGDEGYDAAQSTLRAVMWDPHAEAA